MANPEHLKVVKDGAYAIWRWLELNPGETFDLSEADLRGANLAGADLRFAKLRAVDLSAADLSKAYLFLADLNQANLSSANLAGAHLFQSDFIDADLKDARLNGADLKGAGFSDADLRGADLREADLGGADLRRADLRGADLREANLEWAVLIGADLADAQLNGSICDRTSFRNAELSGAIGLDAVDHRGPSHVGIETLSRIGGKIPAAFLRGCGVVEDLIEAIPSIVGEPCEADAFFIGYGAGDEEFAKRLHARMRQATLRVWLMPEDRTWPNRSDEEFGQSMRAVDKLVVVLSEQSIANDWVSFLLPKSREIEVAEKCRLLFPIRLVATAVAQRWECVDAETGTDSAAAVRERGIADFTKWRDPVTFEAAFAGLLNELKTNHVTGERT